MHRISFKKQSIYTAVLGCVCGVLFSCSSASDSGIAVEPSQGALTKTPDPVQQTSSVPITSMPTTPNPNNEDPTAKPLTTYVEPENQEPPEPVVLSKEEAALVAGAASVACDASAATFSDTMVAIVNKSRLEARMCGKDERNAVGTVVWNDQLAKAARGHAKDMESVNFFDHMGSDGLGVSNRAEAASYNWRAIGENIAAGQSNMESVHGSWLDSAGHCRNIMNSIYTEIGAACVTSNSANFGTYWVVVFGDELH